MIPQYQSIPQNFVVRIIPPKTKMPLSSEQEAEIERIWEEQCRSTHLFNGQLFSVLSITDTEITGMWVEYKHMIAQRFSPTLQSTLNITPLGVCSITTCTKHILMGRRGKNLANAPDSYECAPSGGVDPSIEENSIINTKKLILKELEEETSLSSQHLLSIDISKLYFDPQHHIYELVAKIELHPEALKQIVPTAEYPELFWLKKSEILPFLKLHKDSIMPLSRTLLMGEHL